MINKIRELFNYKAPFPAYSFLYKGEYGYFEPLGNGKCRVSYNGIKGEKYYDSVDEYFNDPFYFGKTILEIADEISELEPIF